MKKLFSFSFRLTLLPTAIIDYLQNINCACVVFSLLQYNNVMKSVTWYNGRVRDLYLHRSYPPTPHAALKTR